MKTKENFRYKFFEFCIWDLNPDFVKKYKLKFERISRRYQCVF